MTRGQLPRRAGSLGLNGGGAAAAVLIHSISILDGGTDIVCGKINLCLFFEIVNNWRNGCLTLIVEPVLFICISAISLHYPV